MPSSFSRFLSAEELKRVRELYFESLNDEGKPGEDRSKAPLDAAGQGKDAAPSRPEENG